MTNKERFELKMKEYNIKDFMDLNVKVKLFLKEKGLIDEDKVYEKANSDYSNFMKKIDDDVKHFSKNEIVALEEILNVRFSELITDSKKEGFCPDGIRYIAYTNSYNDTKGFALRSDNIDNHPLTEYDEFGNNFLDYIAQYQSLQCLEFLVKERGLIFDSQSFRLNDSGQYYSSPKTNINIVKLLIREERDDLLDAILLNRFPYYSISDNDPLYNNDELLDMILKSDKILKSILSPVKGKDKNGNEHISSKIYVNKLLKKAMEDLNKKRVILQIINQGIKTNQSIRDNINKLNISRVYSIDDNGAINTNFGFIGYAVRYNYQLPNDVDVEIKNAIDDLEKSYVAIMRVETTDYLSGKKHYVSGNKEYVSTSNNEVQYEMMKYMNEIQYDVIPVLYDINEQGQDIIEYVRINERYDYHYNKKDTLKSIAQFLKEFHSICDKKLSDGQVYVHGDLYKNVLIENNKVIKVKDWENCYIGDRYDDLVSIIFNLCGFKDSSFYQDDLLKNIDLFLKEYGLSEHINLGERLINYIDEKIEKIDITNKYSKYLQIEFKKSKIVVEEYINDLNKY